MHHDLIPSERDHEGKMARADLFKLAQYSFKLFKMLDDNQQLDGWVQAKITKAADYIASVYHYLEYEMKFSDYGQKLENSDLYVESIRNVYTQKLTEAKKKMDKLKASLDKKEKEMQEGFDEMEKYLKDKKGPQPSGGAGKKQGSKYGGGKQKDDEDKEKDVKEGFPTVADAKARHEKEKGTGKFDKKKISTGTVYTRKAEKSSDDEEDTPKSKKVKEGAKPDFLDMDKDGNKKEPIKKAVAYNKKNPFSKKVKEDLQSGTSGAQAVRYYSAAVKKLLDVKNSNPKLAAEWNAYSAERDKYDQISPRGLEGSATEDGKMAMSLLKKYGIPIQDPKPQSPSMLDRAKGVLGMKEDTRLAMRRGSGADMLRYEKDSPAPGAKKHRDDTAKAAKELRASGKKLGDQDEAKVGDKTVTRYSREKSVKEVAMSPAPAQKKSGISSTATTTVPGMRATPADLKKANSSAALGEGKCNQTMEGKSCPVHGLKECPMEESVQTAVPVIQESAEVARLKDLTKKLLG